MEDFDGFILEHVPTRIEILKTIDPDKLYKSEKLCADFWDDFDGWHTHIGKRIKALSDSGKLPIEAVDRTSCNKWLYRLL